MGGMDNAVFATALAAMSAAFLAIWQPDAAAGGACPDTPHRIESFSLPAPALGRSKRILVYLPPGYDCEPGRRYPVFYFNDGHDLFEDASPLPGLDAAIAADLLRREAWYGSWQLDRQIDGAIAAGIVPPLIVVGIASDDGMRSVDLAPVAWDGSADGLGALYGGFVADSVVPAIDQRFRTRTDRRCRGIAGASLGAISALQIGLDHGDRFGLVLALSPVLVDPALGRYVAAAWLTAGSAGPLRLLVDFDDDRIGGADRRWFASLAGSVAARRREVRLTRTPGGRHRIDSWASRVMPALALLQDGACPAGQGQPAPPSASP